MNSITVKGKIDRIDKVENIYKSTIVNAINDSFITVRKVEGEFASFSGVVNSNYQEMGEKYLEQFKKACLQVFQEDELTYEYYSKNR